MTATNTRISELIRDVQEQRLLVRPAFQRRLVWTNKDKEFFLDTVLKNLPFPEIFIATGSLDRKTMKRQNWLVDGQQRVTTLLAYVEGSPDIRCQTILPFAKLDGVASTTFLDYEVAVRDLGSLSEKAIKEIFRRINSTDYALKSMEVLNAMYSGEYHSCCETLSRHRFFSEHGVFPPAARKRMYDITFCVILVTTIQAGYYRRDEKNEEYLQRYNDSFPMRGEIEHGLERVFDFIEACAFDRESRAWKQTDLFTLLVELYSALIVQRKTINNERAGAALKDFFSSVDRLYAHKNTIQDSAPREQSDVFAYMKAGTKATNDKYARVERARIISSIIDAASASGPISASKDEKTTRSGVDRINSSMGAMTSVSPQRLEASTRDAKKPMTLPHLRVRRSGGRKKRAARGQRDGKAKS